MIRKVLSENGNILYAAVAFFLCASVFVGYAAMLVRRGRKSFEKHEELPFHE